ncbi:MAG: hypothetical protein V1857_05545 [archaeon]
MSRPLGVTVVAVLELISGIAVFITGLLFILFAAFVSSILPALFGLVAYVGAILTLLGIASMILGFGLLKGKSWARTFALALSILGLVTSGVTLVLSAGLGALGLAANLPALLVNVLIIYYLTRPHVEAYFVRSQTREYQAYPPLFGRRSTYVATSVPSATQASVTPVCPICGQPLSYVQQYGRWYCYYCRQYL